MTDSLKVAIERILLAGVMAPSGDNVQPWRFETLENRIDVFLITPEVKDFALAYSRMAHLIAHGALLENIIIAARHYGCDTEVEMFPEKDDSLHTLRIRIMQKESDMNTVDDLHQYIAHRATDRTGYSTQTLSSEEKELIQNVPKVLGIHNADIRFVEDRKTIHTVARIVVTHVKLLFSYKGFHREFYSVLRWTNKQAYETRDGVDMLSLRLNFLKQTMVHYILRQWPLVKLGSFFGLHYVVAFFEALRYRKAGAYCAIVTQGKTDIDNINSGRILQHVWLLATKHTLSMQPTSTTMLLKHEADRGVLKCTPKQHAMLTEAGRRISRVFNVQEGEDIQHVFRIGHSRAVSHKSLRRYPDVTKLID